MKGLCIAPLLVPLTVSALPGFSPRSPTMAVRQKASAFLSILEFISDQIGNDADAWDYDARPDMCSIEFSTYAGGSCDLSVTCDNGNKVYDDFQVCEIGKQQYWHDPRVGHFSIEYTQAGGINSEQDGLHHPVLRFKTINAWEPLKVNDFAANIEYNDDWEDPMLCWENFHQRSAASDGKDLAWGCGIPKLGKGGFNYENDRPDGERGYAIGTCALHVVQHQKVDPSKDPYSLEVWVKDANQEDIGSVYPAKKVRGKDRKLSVTSKLPLTVEFRMGAVDADGIGIAYGKDAWNTDDDGRCNVGDYDEGSRQIDCEFKCGR